VKSLVIGNGQVGQSLYNVLKQTHEVYIRDIEPIEINDVKVIHLCFPYSDKFVEIAENYIELYKPELTINHASVAVGTTEKLKGRVCYSPIRGKHPKLEKGIETFDKYIASNDPLALQAAYLYFKVANIPAKILGMENGMRALEFCKLMSNIRYGWEIVFMQEAERIAKQLNVDIEQFNDFEVSYNKGYRMLQEHYLQRPIMFGGVIGGHCVRQCTEIINNQSITFLRAIMETSNEARKKDGQEKE
jgi:hypothetical protein